MQQRLLSKVVLTPIFHDDKRFEVYTSASGDAIVEAKGSGWNARGLYENS
jgi:hypothetical protein